MERIRCIRCEIEKPIDEMISPKICRLCRKIKYRENQMRKREAAGGVPPAIARECIRCKIIKQPDEMFSQRKCKNCEGTRKIDNHREYYLLNKDKLKGYYSAYQKKNRTQVNFKGRRFARQNPERVLFYRAKSRARKYYIEFNIDLSDIIIPEFCPILGIPLKTSDGRKQENSPSLDRIDNTRGYVKGNVAVISYRANAIKNDATVQEIEKLLVYMRREA